jgi:hypothetical protein
MPGRTFVAPSRNVIAAAALVFVTGIVALWQLQPREAPPHFYGQTHFSAPPVRNVFTEIFAAKSQIVIPAPAQPSAYEAEQQMSNTELMHRWNPMIADAAKRFGIPVAWIRAVMQLESGGHTMLAETQPIISRAGAMGLMQLMPKTYDDMRRAYRLGANPYDPRDNIMAGAAYLRFLRSKYAYPALFEAYNDGPGHLEERLKTGNLLPVETQTYVANITRKLEGRGPISYEALAKFTRPNGEPVWVNAAIARRVRAPAAGEFADGVQTVITLGRGEQGVREPVAEVMRELRARGAPV